VWVEGYVLKKILRYRSLLLRRYCISIWENLDTDGLDGLLFGSFPLNEEGFRYLGPPYFSPSHDAVYVRRSGEDKAMLNKEDVDFTVFDRAIHRGRPVFFYASRGGYNCELYEVDGEGLIDEVVENVVDKVYVYRGNFMMYEFEVVMLSTPMHYLKALRLLEPHGYRIYRMHPPTIIG